MGRVVAWVQLRLTWELTRVARFDRPSSTWPITRSRFPTGPPWALPALYLGRRTSKSDPYWGDLGTTPGEAIAYVGVVPLILACVGLLAARRDRLLTPWCWMVALALRWPCCRGGGPKGSCSWRNCPGSAGFEHRPGTRC